MIRTNDPGNRRIELTVVGKVEAGLQLQTRRGMGDGAIENWSTNRKRTGSIYSPLFDKFEITEVKTDLPTTQITWVP